MNERFDKAVVVGCGLIGGSLALALRESGSVRQMVAVDEDSLCREWAVEHGVVDEAFTTMAEAVSDADLIILGTPVRAARKLLSELASLPLRPGCIITDVCGTKSEICATAADVLPEHVHFIGGHPMAGSEKSGVRAAHPRLFEHAIYVLTPLAGADEAAFAKWAAAVEGTKAQVLALDADVHDEVVAAISHVPHIVAAMLVDQVAQKTGQERIGALYPKLAAGGFRDVTRIASGHPVLWRDIVLSNRPKIQQLLSEWKQAIERILEMMDKEAGSGIEQFFEKAAQFRDSLPAKSRGAVRSVYEISLDAADEPGVIGQVATLIGMHGINLNGVSLIESREEDNGQLLLAFPSRREMEAGAHVLLVNGFRVYDRE